MLDTDDAWISEVLQWAALCTVVLCCTLCTVVLHNRFNHLKVNCKRDKKMTFLIVYSFNKEIEAPVS